MRRRRLATAALLSALLQFALNTGDALGLVLCSTVSGHVALESVLSEDCCTEPSTARTDPAIAADCHCTDTPIFPGSIELRSKTDDAPSATHLPLTTVLVPLDRQRVASSCRDREGLRKGPPVRALSSRRSIVLLV